MSNLRKIQIWTDGSCPNNGSQRHGPCHMGAGIVAVCGEVRKEWSVALGEGTNQQAELLAIKIALQRIAVRSGACVLVTSDSQYAIGVLTKRWRLKKNVELIMSIRALIKECGSFTMTHCKGHAGDAENERADELAAQAVRQMVKEVKVKEGQETSLEKPLITIAPIAADLNRRSDSRRGALSRATATTTR